MKYYETSFEEYIQSSKNNNLHEELDHIIDEFPSSIDNFHNLILYGPSGTGKYTQALKIIEKYSPSKLKYDRKISVSNEKVEKKKQTVVETTKKKTGQAKKEINVTKKQDFTYRISDIHYEIDMSLLGCNSKNLWHDIYFQIIDIISVKPKKTGIIVCKNFDSIYNELLDIFYSYIKHPLEHLNIYVYFIIITENISFIPNNILNSSLVVPIKRPNKMQYMSMINSQTKPFFFQTNNRVENATNVIMDDINDSTIINAKELFMMKKINSIEELPCDIDFTICDKIIDNMENPSQIVLIEFRNLIYDLLVYNVNVPECIYYIVTQFIEKERLSDKSISKILKYSYSFFKYYNNNYRSIYHLENMIFFIINEIHFKGSVIDKHGYKPCM